MKQLFCLCICFTAMHAYAQDAYTAYRISDSLYRSKAYLQSARATVSGIRQDKEKDLPLRYMYAAGAYTRAGMKDSAWLLLQPVAASDRISPAFVRNLAANKDLKELQDDPRWQSWLNQATAKAASNYQITEKIYGHKEGVALSMLHLTPARMPNKRAIIRVVAGSWYSSYEQAENYVMSSYDYLQQGFQVFHVMVGSNPRYNIPEQMEDVQRAVRFIRYHAAQYGIDGNKIGIEGGSAGGHLSLAVAFADDKTDPDAADPVNRVSSRVQAVAVLYPPTDFLNWGGKGMNMVSLRPVLEMNRVWGALDFKELNRQTMTYVPVTDTAKRNRIAMSVSPMYAISADDPPVFVMHGDADATVPIQQTLWLVEKMKAAGIVHRFVLKPGGNHNPEDMMPEWRDAVQWFAKHLQ